MRHGHFIHFTQKYIHYGDRGLGVTKRKGEEGKSSFTPTKMGVESTLFTYLLSCSILEDSFGNFLLLSLYFIEG